MRCTQSPLAPRRRALVTHLFPLALLAISLGLFGVVATAAPVDLGPTAVLGGGSEIGKLSVWINTTNSTGGAGGAGDIYSEFTTNNGFTQATAATQAGGGHFNWLNVVRSGTANTTPGSPADQSVRVGFPWIDPLSGGNLGPNTVPVAQQFNLPDDTLPFYWGEAAPTAGEVAANTVGNTLRYFDHPGNAANVTWNFETYLVAVPGAVGQVANKTFIPLIGFDWKFTENGTGTGSTISNLTLQPIDLAYINVALQGAQSFPAWTAVPEPTSVTLLVVGIATLWLQRRFRRRAA